MRRKSSLVLAGRFRRLLSDQTACVYCGIRATTVDHFVPVSVVAVINSLGDFSVTGRFLVPACGECNSIAGDRIFKTIGAKRRYIQDRLRSRWHRVLDIPSWSESDLADMGPVMRQHIMAGLAQKAYIEERLLWRNTSHHEHAKLAAVRFQVIAIRRSIVHPDAVRKLGVVEETNSYPQNTIASLSLKPNSQKSKEKSKPRKMPEMIENMVCINCGRKIVNSNRKTKYCSAICRSKYGAKAYKKRQIALTKNGL